MGLIDVVKRAQALSPLDAQGAGLCGLKATWLGSEEAPSAEVGYGELVSWRGLPAAAELVDLRQEKEELLISELQAKPDDSLSINFLDGLLRSYFEQVVNPNPNLVSEPNAAGVHPSGKKRVSNTPFPKVLRKAAPHLGQKLLSLTLRACLVCKDFDAVKAMLDSHALSGNTHPDLVPTLIEHDQAALLCMWVRNICDPRFSDLLLVLKYFLKISLRAGNDLARVRSHWQNAAETAIQRLSEMGYTGEGNGESKESVSDGDDLEGLVHMKKNNVKEEVIFKALLLSAAVDRFQPYELCLHYLVCCGHDEAVLMSILSQLDNNEVLRLLRYLRKWLEKYSRRGSLCALRPHRKDLCVPRLGDILQWVSVLADAHLMSLILCTDFHAEIRTVQLLIKGFVDVGHKLVPLVGVTEHLRTKAVLPAQASVHGEDDHVIEYLEI